jgi:type VI protein secretion system component VasF
MSVDPELQAAHDQLSREVTRLRRESERLSRARAAAASRPRGFRPGVAVGAAVLVALVAVAFLLALGELFAHFPGG